MAHSNKFDFWCNIGQSDGVLQWLTTKGGIFNVIFVNQVDIQGAH